MLCGIRTLVILYSCVLIGRGSAIAPRSIGSCSSLIFMITNGDAPIPISVIEFMVALVNTIDDSGMVVGELGQQFP